MNHHTTAPDALRVVPAILRVLRTVRRDNHLRGGESRQARNDEEPVHGLFLAKWYERPRCPGMLQIGCFRGRIMEWQAARLRAGAGRTVPAFASRRPWYT